MSKLSSNISCFIGCPADQSANMHLRTQLILEIKSELNALNMTQVEAATLYVINHFQGGNYAN